MQPTKCLRSFCNLQHTATDPAAFVTNAIQEDTGILLQHYYKLVLYGPGEKITSLRVFDENVILVRIEAGSVKVAGER